MVILAHITNHDKESKDIFFIKIENEKYIFNLFSMQN
jgi:hypothetical protein